jgi:hypothetical protein
MLLHVARLTHQAPSTAGIFLAATFFGVAAIIFGVLGEPIVLLGKHQQMGAGGCILRGPSRLAEITRLGPAVFGVHGEPVDSHR